ncbi:hypothetical protein BGZ65_007630 [Modicella reniformis]|uniref:Alanyl-tRNA synthetase class IIc N-terminal domain-containing protein n=1 Tax=Modicella reniformis TaxID=1440133 RepID=A0A9P6MB79_9FUNG|nr:hypothetical protein BGZ65_007630 [Modicella reniformis]
MLRHWNVNRYLLSSGMAAKSQGHVLACRLTRSSTLFASGKPLEQRPPLVLTNAYLCTQRRSIRQMTTPDLRREFIEYFVKDYGHEPVKSSSLIPHNDKSLMFTNAGRYTGGSIFGHKRLQLTA